MSARCSGDCEKHSHPAPAPADKVDSPELTCCEISPTEPFSPAAFSKALQNAKYSPDNDQQVIVEFLQTPGFIFAEKDSADFPVNHDRQSLLCTFRI